MAENATFHEISPIEIVTAQFGAELQKIESQWSQSVQRLAMRARKSGLDASQLLNNTDFHLAVLHLETGLNVQRFVS